MTYTKIQDSYETDFYLRENFSIYGSLNCPNRHPTPQNTCFCSEPLQDSIYPQCQQYKNKKNQCMETVCCGSCDINKQNQCGTTQYIVEPFFERIFRRKK